MRACAHQLHWRLLSHHGVSVGQRTLLGRAFYCAYEDSEQIEWPQDIESEDGALGLSLSAQFTSRSIYSSQLTRRASRLSYLLVAPASQWLSAFSRFRREPVRSHHVKGACKVPPLEGPSRLLHRRQASCIARMAVTRWWSAEAAVTNEADGAPAPSPAPYFSDLSMIDY